MPRSVQITAVALAAAVALPQTAGAAQTAADLFAEATPLARSPVPRDAPSLSGTPIADRGPAQLLADAGDPEKLLAQAPAATATPPASSLPRTGSDLLLTLLAGGGLVLVGGGLRVRLRAAEERAGAADLAPMTFALAPATSTVPTTAALALSRTTAPEPSALGQTWSAAPQPVVAAQTRSAAPQPVVAAAALATAVDTAR